MLKSQVQIGGRYTAKVSNQLTVVKIDSVSRYGGWNAINENTKRKVHIKSAQKLRGPADPIVKPVTNGNGERMMTPNQRDLIEKLLDERIVGDEWVTRYQSASLAGTVTLGAADTFIKHMLRSPKRDGNTVHSAPAVDQVKLTTERIAAIGRDAGNDMVTESFESPNIVANTVEAMVADIAGDAAGDMSTFELNTYAIAYLEGVMNGAMKELDYLKKHFNAPVAKNTGRKRQR
jgi:hypothetical protein